MRATTLLKTSSQSEVYKQSMGPQNRGSPNFGNSGSPKTKCHLDVGLMEKHKVYYKGEGDGFPQVRAMVSLVSPSLPKVRPNTKCVPTRH
jgi:hypothetical protein